ncbi:MAG: TonB-dependent receptor [Gallionellaceae bacterium]
MFKSIPPQFAIKPTLWSVFLLFSPPTWADESIGSDEFYFQELPVVFTASRLSQPLAESPSAMTVIDREMIKASGFRTVPDLMRLVPGMYVGFADANRPVVTFHGSQDEYSHRMQILIDGRSIYLPPFGLVSWADIPLQIEDIERIEVVRGPASSSHGANSFYGVINILTREAVSQKGGSVSVNYGDVKDVSARFGSAGEQFDYRVSAGYRSDNGYDNRVLNDHNATRLFNFRSNYHPDFSNSVDVQIGVSQGAYGLGIAEDNRPRAQDPFRESTAKSDFQQVSWQHLWSDAETKITYSRTVHSAVDPHLCIDKYDCRAGKSSGFVSQEVSSERNELELQNTNQLGDSNRLIWGGAVRRDYANYPLFFAGKSKTLSSWQLFAHDEWRITPNTILNIGTMFEDNGMGNRSNSPRAALNYHLTPQHTFRLGVSTAIRNPVMTEAFIEANNTIFGGAYAPPVGQLNPEKIISREFGYIGEFRSLGITLDARAYIDQVSDMIWWDKYSTGGPPYPDSYKNLLSAEYKGIDTTVKYHWNEGLSFLIFNYAYQQATASLGSIPTQYFNSTPDPLSEYASYGDRVKAHYHDLYLRLYPESVPLHNASILLSQRIADSWQLSAGYYFRGAVRVMDVEKYPEDTMRRLDLRLAKIFRFDSGRSAEVAFTLQNATESKYWKYGTIKESASIFFTRRGWLTATLNF